MLCKTTEVESFDSQTHIINTHQDEQTDRQEQRNLQQRSLPWSRGCHLQPNVLAVYLFLAATWTRNETFNHIHATHACHPHPHSPSFGTSKQLRTVGGTPTCLLRISIFFSFPIFCFVLPSPPPPPTPLHVFILFFPQHCSLSFPSVSSLLSKCNTGYMCHCYQGHLSRRDGQYYMVMIIIMFVTLCDKMPPVVLLVLL